MNWAAPRTCRMFLQRDRIRDAGAGCKPLQHGFLPGPRARVAGCGIIAPGPRPAEPPARPPETTMTHHAPTFAELVETDPALLDVQTTAAGPAAVVWTSSR